MIDRVIDNIRIKAIGLAEELDPDNEIPKIIAGVITKNIRNRIEATGLSMENSLQKEIIIQCIKQRMIEYLSANNDFVHYNELLIQKKHFYKSSYYRASKNYLNAINLFARHLQPKEAFGILFDGLEGKLSGDMQMVYDDMRDNYSEWLNIALEFDGDFLIVYMDPENIAMGGVRRFNKKLKYSEKITFNVEGLIKRAHLPLYALGDKFVEFIYGRKYIDFPQDVKSRYLTINLPPEGKILPVYRIASFFIYAKDKSGGVMPEVFTRAVIPIDNLLK